MEESTPAVEPATEEDLDRIEATMDGHPPDDMVLVGDIAPLIKRLVAEVRRLMDENRRLLERVRNLES